MGNQVTTNQEFTFSTEVRIEKFKSEWNIKNFNFFPHETGNVLCSPNFNIGNDVSGHIELFPKGLKSECSRFVSLFLCLDWNTKAISEINLKCDFAIVKSGTALRTREMRHIFKGPGRRGFEDFIERCELMDKCVQDDSFVIKWEIERALSLVTESSSIPGMNSKLKQATLGDDFQRLLNNRDESSDVTIIVKNKRIPAHKVLLAARSPVFAAMFKHKELKENRTNCVKIYDMKPEIAEAILEFIYTDEVTILDAIADQLIAPAHKYQLTRLITMCELALCRILNPKNFGDIVELAELYGSAEFKNHIGRYVANYIREQLKTDNNAQSLDPELLEKVSSLLKTEQKK